MKGVKTLQMGEGDSTKIINLRYAIWWGIKEDMFWKIQLYL